MPKGQVAWNKGKTGIYSKKSFSDIIKRNSIDTIEKAINCLELRDLNNGITLCKECHKLTDNYKNKRS